jgi:hypothetical protein
MRAFSRIVLGLLGGAAALPFAGTALVACTRHAEGGDAGATGARAPVVAAAVGSSASVAASSSAPAIAPSSASAAASASASASASSTPDAAVTSFVLGPSREPTSADVADCRKLQAAHDRFVATHRACAADIDCTFAYASCGLEGVCGTPMRAADTTALKPLDDAFVKRGCLATLAVPCPTCAPPGRIRCKDGSCAAER